MVKEEWESPSGIVLRIRKKGGGGNRSGRDVGSKTKTRRGRCD